MRIVVLGYIIRGPLGGLAWHHFQYVLGLKALGHDVLFVEDSSNFAACYDPSTYNISTDPQFGIKFISELFEKYGCGDNWAYFDFHTNSWLGQTKEKAINFCNSAEIVLNISGMNHARDWWLKIPKRVYIDTDPCFVQIRHLVNRSYAKLARLHNYFFSFGENIGTPGCEIPLDGFDWKPTRQPVYLPAWKVTPPAAGGSWTTVIQWDSYNKRVFRGKHYGMKSLSFKEYYDLPKLVPGERFELALGSKSRPDRKLKKHGWHQVDSMIPTRTPWTYQEYLQQSKGEWSVAKYGYVVSNSGWFSERSACYLATGKPVIVQDTGFSKILPVGNGLFSFSTWEEAVDQFTAVNKDYIHHCKKARWVAEEYFDSGLVLKSLIERAE